ncbi:MAG: preprotein translocase subunit SecG [Flavobacteriaceae bacterium]
METVIIAIHLMIVVALVGVILLQKSEGGALGIGGGGGGFMTGRGAANALTRTTTWLAAAFFVTSIGLTILHRTTGDAPSILDRSPAAPGSSQPAAPTGGQTGGNIFDRLGQPQPAVPPATAPDTSGQQPAAPPSTTPQPSAPQVPQSE